MENIEKVKEEIKKQLLNVKLMVRDDQRYLNYKKPEDEEENHFFISYYDPTKDDSYFKIVEFNDDYKISYAYYIICETISYGKPELFEMKIEFDEDGYFHIFADYTVLEYYGKINNI